MNLPLWWRRIVRAVLVRILVYGLPLSAALWWMMSMPGPRLTGGQRPATPSDVSLATGLRRDVEVLASEIGERNVPARVHELARAADYVETSLTAAGYPVRSQVYSAGGADCRNLEAAIRGAGRPGEIVVVGAHYDSVTGSPGADDNASGVAALLALTRFFAHSRNARTLRFVAFANEEPPYFWQVEMGSLVYAKECRRRGENVVAMVSLESVGYFRDAAGSQHYPAGLSLLYPSAGNFVAFVGNLGSRGLLRDAIRSFRGTAALPSEGAALPNVVPGVGWSDHWSFWEAGYHGIEVTDSAPFRNPYYHTAGDTPDRLDYARLARFTVGMREVVARLANPAQ